MIVKQPAEGHLKLMRNLEAGRHELDGFLVEQSGMQAYFQCILNGWVNHGQLTDEGRAVLAAHPITPQKVSCVVLSATPDPIRKSE